MTSTETDTPVAFPKLLTIADTTEAERTRMTKETSILFVQTVMGEQADKSAGTLGMTAAELENYLHRLKMGQVFAIQVALKRLQVAGEPGLVYSPHLFCFLIAALPVNVASVVMLMHWLVQETYKKPSGVPVDSTDLSEAFPFGFPTDDGYHRIWDAQKARAHGLKGDNLMDCAGAWKRPA